MKAAAFALTRAASVAEAATLLASGDGAARLLAGGQSLVPMLNLRLARAATLVDIKRTPGLREVAEDADTVSIGAAFTHAEIEDGVVPDPAAGLLRHVAAGIAYRAVRCRGTLGGSLAHADPAADWVSTMAALGAVMVATGPAGPRRLRADAFLLGAFTTALHPDEVLTAVEVPRLSPTARWGYHKVCRKTGEFARAIGIAILDPARGLSRVLAGAVDGPPVLLPATAIHLAEAGPDAAAAGVAAELAALLPRLAPAALGMHVVALRRALEATR